MRGEDAYHIRFAFLPGVTPPPWEGLSWSEKEKYERIADEANAKIAADNERKVPYA